MTERIFQAWNWEFDYGENPMPDGGSVPAIHAVAYYDDRDRLYRVEEQVSPSGFSALREGESPDRYCYEYYCDENGRILQKRSLGEHGEVAVIVDFRYDDQRGTVTETVWSPDGGFGRSIRRPYSHPGSR
jgi:hypothetical protein